MEYVNMEDRVAATLPLDHYNEKLSCLLEDDDIDCGSIVYNEKSRVLKFICMYCSKGYDNIQYFCQHLTEHIDSSEVEDQDPVDEDDNVATGTGGLFEEVSEIKRELASPPLNCFVNDENNGPEDHHHRDSLEFTQDYVHQIMNPGHDDISVEDMIIEEVEDSEEIPHDVIHDTVCEDISHLEQHAICSEENSYENVACIGGNTSTTNSNGFEECFLKESNIEKIRSQGIVVNENKEMSKLFYRKNAKVQDILRLRRRRGKKVTTVKVIAVKNRVAEIYDRIKNEQAKSQKMLASNGFLHQNHTMDSISMANMEQETQDALESLSKGGSEENLRTKNSATPTTKEIETSKEVTRKIIGETLITLIPEGTKIPNTLPSPVERFANKFHISPPKIHKLEDRRPPSFKSSNSDKRAICPACGKIFRSHFSLTIHKRIHYLESDSAVKLAHKCPDCDQLFNKLSQLKQHVESIHYPDGFVCKICNRKLSSLSLLERHMIKVHLDRPFNCQQCGKNFSDPVTYEEHVLSHNSGEVYKCQVCGRKYSTEFFLMEHMRNHKEQIPQTCVVCGKVTLRITQHMKIHTPRPKRLLSCSVCGKVFNFSSGLSHHFKIMHKLPRPPPKAKKEHNTNAPKRKRKSKSNEKASKNDENFTISSDAFNTSGQVIEEPSEIPDVVYNDEDLEHIKEQQTEEDSKNHLNHLLQRHHFDEEDVNHKEEEAKRVIVELIQNSTYTSFFPDNLSSVLEVTPPIAAREETISAVNSIVRDC